MADSKFSSQYHMERFFSFEKKVISSSDGRSCLKKERKIIKQRSAVYTARTASRRRLNVYEFDGR